MEIHVFVVVLLVALLHATWNAFIKVDGDRLLSLAAYRAVIRAMTVAPAALVAAVAGVVRLRVGRH